MQENPRIGLVLMRTHWGGCAQADELQEDFQASTRKITDHLRNSFQLAGPWVVDSAASLATCQAELKKTELDMVLLAFQSWADESLLPALLEAVEPRPLVLWCYLPWRRIPHPAPYREMLRSSGPVSAFNALGTLRSMNVPFLFTWGAVDDPRLLRELQVAGRAASARSALRAARFGIVPARRSDSPATAVDEDRLLAELGPTIEAIPVESYRREVDAVAPEEARAYLDAARRDYEIHQVSGETLERAARAALGLSRLAAARGLDLVALDDASPELERAFQMRVALYPSLPGLPSGKDCEWPVLYLPEADLGAATACYILNRLTGSPTMFVEFWFWDEALNRLVGGHNGLQNPAVGAPGEVWISRDYDFCRFSHDQGAQIQMIARPGRVTIFQLRSTPTGWQAVAASGVSLESRPEIEGYPHVLLRIDTPIEHLFNRLAEVGAAQHWVMAYGSVLHEIEAFCQMMRIPLEVLRY